ncbi:lactate utilization protein [Flavobacteriaceae bacterium]|nr:lactate utilization protein [Flavobacteriaceae bacterium]
MGLFSNIFGSKKKEQNTDKSPYLASKKDPKELHFARVFTEKGGKFIFSENVEQTRNYFHRILAENGWGSSDLKSDSKSLNSFFNITVNPEALENKKATVQLLGCEYLIANKGSVLVCSHQIQNLKLDELPENLIILASAAQFVEDVSEAMTMINTRYKEDLPSNITTLNTFDTNKEDDFLSYGSSTKNLYLLVQEDS